MDIEYRYWNTSKSTDQSLASIDPFEKKPCNIKVLLAEDNPTNRLLLQKLFELKKIDFEMVSNGKEAISAFQNNKHDLIFMDYHMPIMDGIETTKNIRKMPEGKRIKIIALSASASRSDEKRCIAAGMDDFLTKPVDLAHIIKIIADVSTQVEGRYITEKNTQVIKKKDSTTVFKKKGKENDNPLDVCSFFNKMNKDIDFLAQLLKKFQSHYKELRKDIKDAIQYEDRNRLMDTSHALKGIVSVFEAHKAIALIAEVESSTKKGDLEHASAAADALDDEISNLIDFCNAFISDQRKRQ